MSLYSKIHFHMRVGAFFSILISIHSVEAWCCLDHQENCSVVALVQLCNDSAGCTRCGGEVVTDLVERERGVPFGVLRRTQKIFVPGYVVPFQGHNQTVGRRLLFWDFFTSVVPNFITSVPTMIWDGITGMLPKVNVVGRDSLKSQTQDLVDLTRRVADGAAENALLINETNRLREEGDRLLAEAIQAHEEELNKISREITPRVALLITSAAEEQADLRMREQESRFNEFVTNQQTIMRVMGASAFIHKLNEISSLFQLQGLTFPSEVVSTTFFVSTHAYFWHHDTNGSWQTTSMLSRVTVTRRSTFLNLLVGGSQEIFDWKIMPIGIGHMPFCLDCPTSENGIDVSIEECYRRLVLACQNSKKNCFVNTNGGPILNGDYVDTTGYSTPFVTDFGRDSSYCNYPECDGLEGSSKVCAAPATPFSPPSRTFTGVEYWSLHAGVGSQTTYASSENGWPGIGRLSTVWLPSNTSGVYGLGDLSNGGRPPPLFPFGGFEQGYANVTENLTDPGTQRLWLGSEDYYPYGTEFFDPVSVGKSLLPPPTVGPWNLTGHLRDLFESGGRANNLRLAEYGPFKEVEVARMGNQAVIADESLFLDSEEILAFYRGTGHLYGWIPSSNCRRETISSGDRMRCYTDSGNDLASGALEVSQALSTLETVHSPDLSARIAVSQLNIAALQEARNESAVAVAQMEEGVADLAVQAQDLYARASTNAASLQDTSAELQVLKEAIKEDRGSYELRVSWAKRNALPLVLAIIMGLLLIAWLIYALVRRPSRGIAAIPL